MIDFSLENASKKITSPKTKEYFQEVISSYHNNNNRAAVVTLYSVVISDILIKLEVLDEIYSDTIAAAILQEIKTFQSANPRNPEWEKDLVEHVKLRTNMIDNADYAHIQALINDRHLCAHPVIDKDDKLYTPNKETVAAHIRNMLEALFLKPAVLSKRILTTILIDIAEKKELLIDEASEEKYIKAKYLENLTPSVEVALFRDLWKFVFRLSDPPSNENRLINYRLLYLLFKRNSAACISKLQSEQEYFSNVTDSKTQLNYLVRFLAENEFLYKDFREDVHLIIRKHVEQNTSAKIVAWFLSGSLKEHFEEIKPVIQKALNSFEDAEPMAYQRLLRIAVSKGYATEVVNFIIWRYSNARNFDDADKIYSYVVQPFLSNFSEPDFVTLCSEAEKNPQVYNRNQAEEDHENLKKHIVSRFEKTFDFSPYKSIF